MVGDVRGKGLMCGIEFVRNQQTKEPFPPDLRVSYRVHTETMKRGLVLYPCSGCVDGAAGDMIQVAPPFIITREQIDEMMGILRQAIEAVQADLMPA
jgi:adenosylmethionine-8-amino-7-oxononanoate aminotransferase